MGKYAKKIVSIEGRTLVVQGYEPMAIRYLLANGFAMPDLRTEKEGVPVIRYKYGKKFRDYYPDLYSISRRIIFEVKSEHTLGLLSNTKRGFSMTCAKAIACHERGYKFCLLLLTSRGQRLYLPKRWPYMKKQDLINEINKLNPDRGTPNAGLFQL